ncbi:MAG TPA: hypothetical protein DEF34_09665 [Desulfotomaculum sp.]|nr:MAG: hypothetical protein VR67_10745 [Peptococcaceae bacterium BRH_c8a]KJS71831.1 MAG: hypothetical protein JL56_14205 [Desulfotomaculum sp. BICA1-6]HBX23880.1 hypothetical protein [Desulfotomaculum sp.]
MKPTPVIIEFAGLPGAGKTTAAEQIIKVLELDGYKCFGREQFVNSNRHFAVLAKKILINIFFVLAHICMLAWCCIFALQVTPVNMTSLKRAVKLIIMRGGLQRVIKTARQGGYDLILLDQGFTQAICSIALTGSFPPDRHLLRLVKCLYSNIKAPYLLVYFDVDVTAAAGRVMQRPGLQSRFDRMSLGQAEREMRIYEQYLKRILLKVTHYTGVNCLVVDSSQDLERTVKLISSYIYQNVVDSPVL